MSKLAYLVVMRTAAVVGGLLLGSVLVEGVFRVLESRDNIQRGLDGAGCAKSAHDRWGWRLNVGECRQRDPEFVATLTNNSLFMNDEPYSPGADDAKTRVLALGDSHTQAVGVSTSETWPKILQRDLNRRFGEGSFRVYNAGTGGYSLHQYLLRLIDQGPQLKPHYVVVGFGFASDLYDLLPPSHGGWHFFSPLPRAYFDFDESGQLVEKHWTPSPTLASPDVTTLPPPPDPAAKRVRALLENFATFRYLRRSNLALAIGARVRLGGESLWPNMEVVLEKEVSPQNEYNWRLAKALLERIEEETTKLGAQLVVLGIPYLPQVYDETWQSTFGDNPKYARDAGTNRLREWLQSRQIPYVDSMHALRAHVQKTGKWVHYWESRRSITTARRRWSSTARLSRRRRRSGLRAKKYDASFPPTPSPTAWQAGITPEDIDYVAFYDKPLTKFERLLETYLAFAPQGSRSFSMAMPLWLAKKLYGPPMRQGGSMASTRARIVFTRATTKATPPARSSRARSRKRPSSRWTGWANGAPPPVARDAATRSPARSSSVFPIRWACSTRPSPTTAAFKVNSGEYKLMGLAPYGQPVYRDLILKHLIDLKPDGSFWLNMDYFNYCQGLTMTNRRFHDLFGGPPRKPESVLEQRHMDLAASIQAVTEGDRAADGRAPRPHRRPG